MRTWLLLVVALAPTLASAEDPTARLLQDALLCKGSPLDAVRSVSAKGAGPTFAATDFGEELDFTNVVVLKTPLRIAGATTRAVIGEVRQSHYDFRGHVYGSFKGDYQRVVKELGLVKSKDPVVGNYELEVEARTPDLVCPKTIGLTPKENGEFLLGCGWCNG